MRLTKEQIKQALNSKTFYGERVVGKTMFVQMSKELIEYKTLEEELGIDLIIFMRILHQMDAQDFKPVEKIDKDWIATPYQNVRYSIDLKKQKLIEHGREEHVLKFKDYGKKWALTKEELKDE